MGHWLKHTFNRGGGGKKDGFIILSASSATVTYNTSATVNIVSSHDGEISVVSDNSSVISASVSGSTVTITALSGTGSANVAVICGESKKFKEAVAYISVTAQKAAGQVVLSTGSTSISSGASVVYAYVNTNKSGGTLSMALISGSGVGGSISGTTLTFSRGSNSASSATFRVTSAATANYASAYADIYISVAQATIYFYYYYYRTSSSNIISRFDVPAGSTWGSMPSGTAHANTGWASSSIANAGGTAAYIAYLGKAMVNSAGVVGTYYRIINSSGGAVVSDGQSRITTPDKYNYSGHGVTSSQAIINGASYYRYH